VLADLLAVQEPALPPVRPLSPVAVEAVFATGATIERLPVPTTEGHGRSGILKWAEVATCLAWMAMLGLFSAEAEKCRVAGQSAGFPRRGQGRMAAGLTPE
jgi:hypothetical protein